MLGVRGAGGGLLLFDPEMAERLPARVPSLAV